MTLVKKIVLCLLINCILYSCSFLTKNMHEDYNDLIDKKPSVTKYIFDTEQLVSDPVHIAYRSQFHKKRKPSFLEIDTFLVIKPLIKVDFTWQDSWSNKPELLDTNAPIF